jgi:hypothetical protein
MKREVAKRLASLETRLLPPPKFVWSIWQRLLSDEEYAFVCVLAGRGARHGGDPADVSTWCDDFPTWATLCRDERELELLARIEAVVTANPDARNRSGWRDALWEHLTDLRR